MSVCRLKLHVLSQYIIVIIIYYYYYYYYYYQFTVIYSCDTKF